MPLRRKLLDEAVVLAASLRSNLADFRAEQRLLEIGPKDEASANRLAVLTKAISFAERGVGRLLEFDPVQQNRLECPYCWILEGKHIQLTAVPGPLEAVTCWNCAAEYKLDRAE